MASNGLPAGSASVMSLSLTGSSFNRTLMLGKSTSAPRSSRWSKLRRTSRSFGHLPTAGPGLRTGSACVRARARLAAVGGGREAVATADGDGGVKKDRQVLRFKDVHTGVDVVLVGTMHYNPASIDLAAGTVRDLTAAGDLATVVLETCETRWTKTLKMQPAGSLMRNLLDNEFQAATEAAGPATKIVLGDQRIEALGASAKACVKSTWDDFTSPVGGGWKRLLDDVGGTYKREVEVGATHATPRPLSR